VAGLLGQQLAQSPQLLSAQSPQPEPAWPEPQQQLACSAPQAVLHSKVRLPRRQLVMIDFIEISKGCW